MASAKTSLAEIKGFAVPQPLIDLFNIFSNWKIDFSKIPIINKIPGYLPNSGEDIGRSFQWLAGGLNNFNNWLTNHIGLNILLIIKKAGEFFVWALEALVNLLRLGLSYMS
jgi:hypothetical protein